MLELVTHASPSGVYAHTAHRDWESNADIKQVSNCNDIQINDIAKQLVYGETGSKLKVIFGGGRSNFIDKSQVDEDGNPGRRSDRRNLIKEWLGNGRKGENRHYIRNKVTFFNAISICLLISTSHFVGAGRIIINRSKRKRDLFGIICIVAY